MGRLLLLLTILGVLAGCAHGEPFEYVAIDEIPPGAGLFSGGEGEFVLFRRGTLSPTR